MLLPPSLLRQIAGRLDRNGLFISNLDVSHVDVPISDLPPSLDGFLIAQVSDLHVGGGGWGPHYAAAAARAVQEVGPDVLAITGDYVQWEPPIEDVAAVVERFLESAGGSDRTISIFGNHDYYTSEQHRVTLQQRLQSMGVSLLINGGTCVRRCDAGVSFVGLTEREPGFEAAVQGLLGTAHPRVVLVHKPDLAEALPAGSADLILAGHTHGGQCTLPGLEATITRHFSHSNYVEGMYRVNGMPLYVNRGLGNTGLPIRFRACPQVTFLRLVR